MLGGFWIRLAARLAFIPLLLSTGLVIFSTLIGRTLSLTPQVAFMSDLVAVSGESEFPSWDIYVMDVNRHLVDRVTWGSGSERFPSWSPDGTKLAFHSNQRGFETRSIREFYDLYTIDPSGRNLTLLTENHLPLPEENYAGQGGSSMADWSPDGTKLGFHTGGNGGWDLAILDLATRKVEYITHNAQLDEFTDLGTNIHFEWSPDGKQVLFASQRDQLDTGGMDIYLLTLETGEVTRLTDADVVINPNSPSPTSEENYPSWSPDGKWIVFSTSRGGLGENIYMMNADGSDMHPLTDSSYQDGFPVWIPDGSGVVFDSDRTGTIARRQLYVVDLKTLTVRQLTDLPANALAPSWRPTVSPTIH